MRQQSNTQYMILGVAELIELASAFYTLQPGDLLFTGTPEGVSPIEAGDRHRRDHRADRLDARGHAGRCSTTGVGDERRHGWRLDPRNQSMDGASTTFFTKPSLTPERKEFYDRLDAHGRGAAVGSARRDHSTGAASRGACRCSGTTTICGRC